MWHRWGIGFLGASLLTLVLIMVLFWVFTPGTMLSPLRLGGLVERVLLIEIEAWYVALGWRLLLLAGSPTPGSLLYEQKRAPEPSVQRS